MKKVYAKTVSGSVMQIVKTSVLKDLNVRFMSSENQERIVKINKLRIKEEKLLKQLGEEKSKYYSAVINRMI